MARTFSGKRNEKHHLRRDGVYKNAAFLQRSQGSKPQWSQTGSNRRLLPCRGSALPAELWNRDKSNCVTFTGQTLL